MYERRGGLCEGESNVAKSKPYLGYKVDNKIAVLFIITVKLVYGFVLINQLLSSRVLAQVIKTTDLTRLKRLRRMRDHPNHFDLLLSVLIDLTERLTDQVFPILYFWFAGINDSFCFIEFIVIFYCTYSEIKDFSVLFDAK
jgi:hypothetical protein